MGRLCLSLAAACALAAPAHAAPRKAQAPEEQSPRLNPDPRPPRGTGHRDMLPLLPIGENGAIGFGRFSVPEPPRPRTHIEAERNPTDVSRRRRGIGGLGLRMAF